jgi:hypothetical protein
VLLRKHGNGYDGDLTVKNFSLQYNFTLSSSDGNGQALRTLIELGAIELYGRMLKLPYWSCLGASDQDPAVSAEIDDWWEEMAADPRSSTRLFGYLQFQMKAQGVYGGEINGRGNEALLRAVRAYELALGMPDDLNLNGRFLHKYLAADHAQVRKVAVVKLAEINQKEGALPPEPVAQAVPQGAPTGPNPTTAQATAAAAGSPLTQNTPAPNAQPVQGAATAQSTRTPQSVAAAPSASATTPTAAPVTAAQPALASASTPAARPAAPQPVAAAQPAAGSAGATAQTVASTSVAAAQPAVPAASMQRAVYRAPQPVATIPIEGSRPTSDGAYRAGEPFFVGVLPPRDGYLYCYLLDDRQHVSQFYPAQTPTRLSGGTLTVLNAESPLVASRAGHRQQVACFSSPKDLGRQPLEPSNVVGLEALKTRFAIAVSGTYAMGVLDVKVQ